MSQGSALKPLTARHVDATHLLELFQEVTSICDAASESWSGAGQEVGVLPNRLGGGKRYYYRMDPPSSGVPLYYVGLAHHQEIIALNVRDW